MNHIYINIFSRILCRISVFYAKIKLSDRLLVTAIWQCVFSNGKLLASTDCITVKE